VTDQAVVAPELPMPRPISHPCLKLILWPRLRRLTALPPPQRQILRRPTSRR